MWKKGGEEAELEQGYSAIPSMGKFSPLKYFRPHAERRKLNARKIKTRIRITVERQNILMRKFKGRIILKAKISRSTVHSSSA